MEGGLKWLGFSCNINIKEICCQSQACYSNGKCQQGIYGSQGNSTQKSLNLLSGNQKDINSIVLNINPSLLLPTWKHLRPYFRAKKTELDPIYHLIIMKYSTPVHHISSPYPISSVGPPTLQETVNWILTQISKKIAVIHPMGQYSRN